MSRPVFAVSLALVAVVLPLRAQEPLDPPSDEAAAPLPAPTPVTNEQASEAELEPPPQTEKAPAVLRPQFRVHNPAFPKEGGVASRPAPAADPGRRYEEADLAPYFASGQRERARLFFEKGKYAEAAKLLRQEGDSPPVRYLRGVSLLRAGEPKAAAALLEALVPDYPAMRDRILVHAAVANEELQRWEKAAALFAQVNEHSRLYPDARLGLFRTLRKQGRLEEAASAIAPLTQKPSPGWGRDVGAEALLTMADLAAKRKDRSAEQKALLQLWGKHPLTRLADQAQKRLKGVTIPAEAKVDRAEALIDAHRNSQGLKLIEPYLSQLSPPDPVGCRAHFLRGKALRKERQHTRAIPVLRPVVEKCQDRELVARALYVLGSSQSIVAMSDGVQTYRRLAKEYPEHSFADDALFYAADLYVKLGQMEAALSVLDELGQKFPEGDFAGEGLFKAFWIRRARGEHAAALAGLDRIERIYANADESYDVERARYWRARLLESLGQKDQALGLFERVALEHPATYYGLIARKRVEERDPARAARLEEKIRFPSRAEKPWPLHAGPMGEDPHLLAGIELLRMGANSAAAAEFMVVRRAGLPPEAVRLLVQLITMTGDARSAHAIARVALRKALSSPATEKSRGVWEIAYPLAYRPLVTRHCANASVEPDLLQALMREESALDANIRSWAGALGLTQLMPATARAVARQLKVRCAIPSCLFNPEMNIRLGSHYLGTLLKQWKGTYEYALASYNAGPRSVAKWREARPEAELDEWVEEIPIAETRGYVKRVLRSYNTYRLLYPNAAPGVRVGQAPTGIVE